MKRKMKSLWYLLLPAALMVSCYPDPADIDETEEQLVAITNVQTDFNFGSLTTFYVSDSLRILSDDGTTKTVAAQQNSKVKAMVNCIADNLEKKGFQQVSDPADADFAIGLSGLEVVNVTTYYPGWWWDYWDYYYPWWDGYYPYYPMPYYPTYTTAYATGTFIMELYDLKNASAESKVPVRWLGIVRGLLSYSHTQDEMLSAINDCFNQTPQLKK